MMNDGTKVRVEWIDVAKAISILLVTLLHFSQLAYAAEFDVGHLVQLNNYLAPVRMPLFFAASGAFAGAALTKPWATLLRSRVGLYLWLFVLWTVVRWTFCALLLANPMNPTEGSAISEIAWAMLMPTTGLWFLWSLAVFFVVSKLLQPFDVKWTIIAATTFSLFAMAMTDNEAPGIAHRLLGNIAHRNTATYFVFFYAAARAPNLVTSLSNYRPTGTLLTAIFVFACCAVATRFLPYPLSAAFRLASSVTGVAALFLTARLLDNWPAASRSLRYIGLNTLPIYVAQVPLISVIIAALRLSGADGLGVWVIFLAPVAVGLAAWLGLKLRDLLIRLGADWFYRLPRASLVQRTT